MSRVSDNTELNRYELDVDGHLSFIDYRRHGSVVTMTHAEVPPVLNGRGIGSELAQGALDLVRKSKETVVPQCPFINSFIKRHAAYLNLLAV
jgi:predicted GNAT family acetyltransferase